MRKIHIKSVNGSCAVARHPTTISCWARCDAGMLPLSRWHSCFVPRQIWFENPPAGRLFLLQFSFLLSAAPNKCCNRSLSSTHFPIYHSTSLFPVLHYVTCAIVTVSLNEHINHKLLETLASDKGRIIMLIPGHFRRTVCNYLQQLRYQNIVCYRHFLSKELKETNRNFFLRSSVRCLC